MNPEARSTDPAVYDVFFAERRQDRVQIWLDGAPIEDRWSFSEGCRSEPSSGEHRYIAGSPGGENAAVDPPEPGAWLSERPIEAPSLDGWRLRLTRQRVEQRVVVRVGEGPPVSDRRRGDLLRLVVEGRGPRRRRIVGETRLRDGDPAAGCLEQLVRRTLERARRHGDARPLRRSDVPVVIAGGTAGVVFHELIGHALEADVWLAGRSWLCSLDRPLGRPDLRVVDDPRRGRMAWRTDDEGQPTRATMLWSDGRVRGLLHDRRTANLSDLPATGHGRRASYRDPVLPRMGCTYVAAGTTDVTAGLTDEREAICVRRMTAGRVDVARGEAVFRVSDADWLNRGTAVHALRPFLLHVSAVDFLDHLRWIGDDLRFDASIGACHRAGQALSVSVGAPTICAGMVRVSS